MAARRMVVGDVFNTYAHYLRNPTGRIRDPASTFESVSVGVTIRISTLSGSCGSLRVLLGAVGLSADAMDGALRSGQTRAVLGHRVLAPSTLGTFLRAFTFGHVRQG